MDANLLVRLILLLPLAGAVYCGVLALFVPSLRKSEAFIGGLATAMVAIPFAIALYLFLNFDGEPYVVTFYTWMTAGDLSLAFAYRIDELSLVMTLIVTGVGALIHLYSIGYMHGDRGYWRYFAFLNLFIFAMLNLVLANNMVVLFLGWEGVGLCSYLLIGFWYTDLKNSEAGNKAFIVNRIGDFAFLVAMFIIFREVGSLDFDAIFSGVASLDQSTLNWIVLLLFFGATGKSAQIPLFVWLPDAMAGPTPVSALIHAATMVTSGLYLLARLSPVVLSTPAIMVVIAIVAALTSIMAATIAISQNDIKKVLAYSTVSQLGYMFMAAGVGAFFVAIFHVMMHAFFKACLFLGSGSVIHAMHDVEHQLEHKGLLPGHAHDDAHEAGGHAQKSYAKLPYDGPFDPQDMRTMGGLARFMPSTSITYFIATLAIAGIPPLAAFFSKDEILFRAFEYGYDGHTYALFVWIIGVITAFLTAFYITRSYYLTFAGKPRWPAAGEVHPHESPKTMTIPLWVLAALSIVGGFIGLPAVFQHGELNWIHHFLVAPSGPVAEPVAEEHGDAFLLIEILLLVVGALIAVAGFFVARGLYLKREVAEDARLERRFGGLYRLWQRKYLWDEAYGRFVVDPLIRFSRKGLAAFDEKVIDGFVNGVARSTGGFSVLLSRIQTGIVQNYALAIVLGVVLVVTIMLFV